LLDTPRNPGLTVWNVTAVCCVSGNA
jgi:hypothetical protein